MHVACTSDRLSGRAQGSSGTAPPAGAAALSFNAVAALDAGVVVRAAWMSCLTGCGKLEASSSCCSWRLSCAGTSLRLVYTG